MTAYLLPPPHPFKNMSPRGTNERKKERKKERKRRERVMKRKS